MAELARAEVVLTGDDARLQRVLSRAEARMATAGRRMQAIGATLTAAVTAPLAAAGGAAAKFATDFDTSMTRVNTLVGVAADQVDRWRDSLLELGPAVGRTPTELADAMFVVTSAGERGAEAMEIVEQAAKASAVGLGETRTVARAATAAMQAFGDQGLTASRAMDILTATVREGNLEASSLAGALGRVLGPAASVGASFEDVGAFIATFTRVGVSAREAVTSLTSALNLAISPTDQARQAMEEAGFSIEAFRRSIEEDGIEAALRRMVEATEGNLDVIGQFIPNVRALRGILATAGAQGEEYSQIARNITESQGILNEAFQTTAQTAGFQFRSALAQLQQTAIRVGANILPALVRVSQAFSNVLDALNPQIIQAGVKIGAIAAAVGPVVIVVGKLVSALGGVSSILSTLVSLVNPWTAAIVGVVAVLERAGVSWTELGATALRALESIVSGAGEMIRAVLNVFRPGINLIIGLLVGAADVAIENWGIIEFEFKRAFRAIRDFARPVLEGFATALSHLGQVGSNVADSISEALTGAVEDADDDATDVASRSARALADAFGKDYIGGLTNVVGQGIRSAQQRLGGLVDQLRNRARGAGRDVGQEATGMAPGAVTPAEDVGRGLQRPMRKIADMDLSAAFDAATGKLDEMGQVGVQVAQKIGSSFSSAFSSLVSGTQSAAEAFANLAQSILSQLASMIARAAVFAAITSAFGLGSGAGFGSVFKSILGGGGIPGLAHGGPVQANRPFLVGEQGPELFVPSTAGEVRSNEETFGGGRDVLSAMPDLQRPQTPSEAARDRWWREFIKVAVADNAERTGTG